MRKLLMVAVLVLSAACASEDKGEPRLAEAVDTTAPRENTTTTTDKDKPAETTTTAAQRAVFAIGDRVETGLGNFVTLHAYEQPVPVPEFADPNPGQEYAAADVEYCLAPEPHEDSTNSIGPFDFELQMGDNTRREADMAVRDPSLNHTDLVGGGECVRGWVTYQVPAGIRPAFLILLDTNPLVKFAL